MGYLSVGSRSSLRLAIDSTVLSLSLESLHRAESSDMVSDSGLWGAGFIRNSSEQVGKKGGCFEEGSDHSL
jgi:hypothetical protein